MDMDTFEKLDLVHIQRRICTVIEVRSEEPRYKVQFGADAGSIKPVESEELALVQKYTPRESESNLVLVTA